MASGWCAAGVRASACSAALLRARTSAPGWRAKSRGQAPPGSTDRKSTRLTPVTNAHLVCRLLLEKKNTTRTHEENQIASIRRTEEHRRQSHPTENTNNMTETQRTTKKK